MQWRCGVCNSHSPVGSGGICTRCRKFACGRHLNTVLTDEKKIRVCTSCLSGEDQLHKGILGRIFGSKA